jgi:hypothetical protein
LIKDFTTNEANSEVQVIRLGNEIAKSLFEDRELKVCMANVLP